MKLTNSVVKHKFHYTFFVSTLKEDKNIINFITGTFIDKNGLTQAINKVQIVKGTIDGVANMLFKYCLQNPSALMYSNNYLDGYSLSYSSSTSSWINKVSTHRYGSASTSVPFKPYSSTGTLSPSSLSYYKKLLISVADRYSNEVEEVPQLPKIAFNNLQLSFDHNDKPHLTFSTY